MMKATNDVRWSVDVWDQGQWIWLEWTPTRALARRRAREMRRVKRTSLMTSQPRRYRVSRWLRTVSR